MFRGLTQSGTFGFATRGSLHHRFHHRIVHIVRNTMIPHEALSHTPRRDGQLQVLVMNWIHWLTCWQVDNVAGLYAGVRDSVLTNHGVDQANRLGDHLAATDIVLTHIFASPLTRTSKTAEAIRKAQATAFPDAASSNLEIVKVPELIEQVRGIEIMCN